LQKKQYNEQIRDLFLKQNLFKEVFNLKEVEKILTQHLNGYNREKQIFLLLSIYYWMKAIDNDS